MAKHWDTAHSRSHSLLKGSLSTQTTPTWALSSVYAAELNKTQCPSFPASHLSPCLWLCTGVLKAEQCGKHNCVASNGSSESSAQIVDFFDFSQDTMKSEGQEENGAMGFSSEMTYLNPGTRLVKSG